MAIEVRSEEWRLTRTQPFGACTVLTLEARHRSIGPDRIRLIEPFDRPRAITPHRIRRRPRRAVLRAALHALTAVRSPGGLWTAADSAIELWPYQLEPALAVIGGATRILLADAVGLGKTIQAALVLAELRERGWVERALIVCPAGLRESWARELRDRFTIDSTIVDQAAVADRIASMPPGINPWSTAGVTIASIDFIKRPEVLAALDGVAIDLLIADEAHHLSPGTDRGDAVSRLALRVPWCVLVSATPHSGDAAAFTYLTSLGAHRDRIAIFRRRRADAGVNSCRRTHALPVRPSSRERALFAAVDRYAQAIWRGRGVDDRSARLVAVTIARRAASSAAALRVTLARRLDLLSGIAPAPAQGALPWDDSDESDAGSDVVLGVRGLDDVEEERGYLERLLAMAGTPGAGSKLHRLLRLLTRVREPAIVFTEYRDTLEAIRVRLPESIRAGAIHGGVAPKLRRAIVDDFNAGHLDVLIATDAAGEGLNLHHRCRLVIDVELPWNPNRLEQRIGRVDRLGQTRPVHAIRMYHPRTIEMRVLDQLQLRREKAEDDLDRWISEDEVAAAVFNSDIERVPCPVIRSHHLIGAAHEAARARVRRHARSLGAIDSTRCWCRSKHARTMVVLHRSTFMNGHGHLVGSVLTALRVSTALEDVGTLIERVRAGIAARPPASRRASIEARLRSIRAHLAKNKAAEYQRSLFDRRAESAADDRSKRMSTLETAIGRVQLAMAPGDPGRTQVEFVAAWPEPRR